MRDGSRYIQKNAFAYEDREHMVDPALRCERHDRHVLLPHERDVPRPIVVFKTTTGSLPRPGSNEGLGSSFATMPSGLNTELLEAAQIEGMNKKFIE